MHPAGSTYAASFGPGQYRVYTCMDLKGVGFDIGKPKEFGTYLGNSPIRGFTDGLQEYINYRGEMGGLVGFNQDGSGTTTIMVRAGMSFISSDQACRNAEEEIPDFDFEGVRAATRATWNELLGRIQVGTENVDDDTIELFYSSLYRTHISPADCEGPFSERFRGDIDALYADSGENPLWNSTEPYYDSFYCNVRAVHACALYHTLTYWPHAVGHVPYPLPSDVPARPRELREDRTRHDQHSAARRMAPRVPRGDRAALDPRRQRCVTSRSSGSPEWLLTPLLVRRWRSNSWRVLRQVRHTRAGVER